jgi:hypothetical protein
MVFIECPSQNVMMFKNQLLDAPQVLRPHAPVAGQTDGWLQPELTLSIGSSDMNVRWFVSLIRVEMESV